MLVWHNDYIYCEKRSVIFCEASTHICCETFPHVYCETCPSGYFGLWVLFLFLCNYDLNLFSGLIGCYISLISHMWRLCTHVFHTKRFRWVIIFQVMMIMLTNTITIVMAYTLVVGIVIFLLERMSLLSFRIENYFCFNFVLETWWIFVCGSVSWVLLLLNRFLSILMDLISNGFNMFKSLRFLVIPIIYKFTSLVCPYFSASVQQNSWYPRPRVWHVFLLIDCLKLKIK